MNNLTTYNPINFNGIGNDFVGGDDCSKLRIGKG